MGVPPHPKPHAATAMTVGNDGAWMSWRSAHGAWILLRRQIADRVPSGRDDRRGGRDSGGDGVARGERVHHRTRRGRRVPVAAELDDAAVAAGVPARLRSRRSRWRRNWAGVAAARASAPTGLRRAGGGHEAHDGVHDAVVVAGRLELRRGKPRHAGARRAPRRRRGARARRRHRARDPRRGARRRRARRDRRPGELARRARGAVGPRRRRRARLRGAGDRHRPARRAVQPAGAKTIELAPAPRARGRAGTHGWRGARAAGGRQRVSRRDPGADRLQRQVRPRPAARQRRGRPDRHSRHRRWPGCVGRGPCSRRPGSPRTTWSTPMARGSRSSSPRPTPRGIAGNSLL